MVNGNGQCSAINLAHCRILVAEGLPLYIIEVVLYIHF